MSLFIISVISLILFITDVYSDCVKMGTLSTDKRLRENLLCNYNKNFRPVRNQQKSVNVTILMVIKSINFASVDNGIIDIRNWMNFMWKDEYLTWNPENYDTVQNIHLPGEKIWVPSLRESKSFSSLVGTQIISETDDCLIDKTGNVITVIDIHHEAKCEIDLTYWPYDTQQCSFTLSDVKYNKSLVNFILPKKWVMMNSYTPSGEWKMKKISVISKETTLYKETYNGLYFTFTIERHSTKCTTLLFIPAIALIVMALVSLRLKPGTTERLCLVTVNILNNFFYIQHMGFFAPLNGLTVPNAVIFFRDSLIVSVVILIESTLISSLLSDDRTTTPTWMLKPCKFIVNGVFRRTLLIEEAQEVKDEEVIIGSNEDNTQQHQMNKERIEDKIVIITVIDILCFILVALTYFILIITKIP